MSTSAAPAAPSAVVVERRKCVQCDAPLPIDVRLDARFCSNACRARFRRSDPDVAARDRRVAAEANRRRYRTPEGRAKMQAAARESNRRRRERTAAAPTAS